MTILLAVWLAAPAAAQDVPTVYQEAVFRGSEGGELPYRIMYPEGYGSGKAFPLLVFLHGAGERGSDNRAQLAHGAKLFADSAVRKAFPAIVVFPQCPANDYWPRVEVETRADGGRQFSFPFYEASGPSLGLVSGLIDSLLAGGRVDADRVYLGGLSMGAMGSYELLARRPNTFAAAMLICGGGHPQLMGLYAPHTPLWIYHGDADNVVPPDMSRRMVRAAEALGIALRYSEYPGVGHDSWTPAFAEPELLKWLFAQRRSHN